ncbi:hypothetical protein [Luteolibacter luteus]|uniref:Uncharacterized protein n=1 Tax=Luteolibacter luteus TaxID=2728835 RepID=A0A858RPW0_9BACT|nr:hypothetical protein [Luteolibacter luteus]QJE98160.1 hypothetical protein HHL09_21015 [Luteolibacter luteus]
MHTPYAPPASDAGKIAITAPGKLTRGFAIAAGLGAFATAAYFVPALARFGTMAEKLGARGDLLMSTLTMRGALVPALVLCSSGLFALASSFTRKRAMILIAASGCLLLSMATLLFVPQFLFAALGEIIRETPLPP